MELGLLTDERRSLVPSDSVDQHVDLPQLLDHSADRGLHLRLVSYVRAEDGQLSGGPGVPGLLDDPAGRILVDVEHGDVGALLRQRQNDTAADIRAATRNDGVLAS